LIDSRPLVHVDELDGARQFDMHADAVPPMLSTGHNIAEELDHSELGFTPSAIDLDSPKQEFPNPFSMSLDNNSVSHLGVEASNCSAICSPDTTYGFTFDELALINSFSGTSESSSTTLTPFSGEDPKFETWIGTGDTGHEQPGPLQKTTFTMENLGSETRAQILDILCKRRISTTINVTD
jgi:hypothetical protein